MQECLPKPTDNDSIDCHLQQVGMGTLICRAAQQRGDKSTNEVNPVICFNCVAGKIYRDVGCDAVLPKVRIFPYSGGVDHQIESLLCRLRKRETTLDNCKICPLVASETTRQLVSETRGLFQSQEYYTAYQSIEKAREAIRDGKFEHAVTQSLTCVESVLKITLEKMGVPLPNSKGVTDLWKVFRSNATIDDGDGADTIVQLLNSLGGVVAQLGGVRNALSDAHGRGIKPPIVQEYVAELSMNTSATLSTVIIRIYKSLKGQHGE